MAATNPRSGSRAPVLFGFALPPALDQLAAEIERSRELLERGDDWDDAGSPGYAEATWDRAIGRLVDVATRLWEVHTIAVTEADVFPGSRGSIDFELRTAGRRLLVSVAADPTVTTRFFGYDAVGGAKVNGVVASGEHDDRLVAWLAG